MFSKLLSILVLFLATLCIFPSCSSKREKTKNLNQYLNSSTIESKIREYAVVKLTTDLNKLTLKEKQMIPVLLEISKLMDDIFWEQTLGNKEAFLDSLTDDQTKKFALINYGPWDRLDGNKPFIPGFGEKPKGAGFYPADMTKAEFEAFADQNKKSEYTLLRRGSDGKLKCIWYHEAYKDKIDKAAALLKQAAMLAEDQGLKNYLNQRSDALLTDNYYKSDMAWMDMKNNTIDFVVGPIETYEDELFGYKTAHEAAILVKDKEWSHKLEKYITMLPAMQKNLPCDPRYKKEIPGSKSDLNAYDILFYAGHSNCGGKTIAINLPNDERVQLAKGSRRVQLKNAMQAKFDKILIPISKVLIDPTQQANIKFDAFFNNVMFHEVAHGLGIKNVVTGKGSVRQALKEQYSAWEEAKADILGLYMVIKLIEKGKLKGISTEDAYVTYMAGLIRSVRFGAADAHGKANMMCFNFFKDKSAFARSSEGKYKVDYSKIGQAINEWSALILKIEGEGDYLQALEYLKKNGVVRNDLG
jgi:hypothetical protein